MVPGEAAAGEQYMLQAAWKQTLLTITIVLTITVVAVGVAMAGTTIAEAVVGAAAGAAAGAAGAGILQSQWEEEGRTQAAVAVTAVAGCFAGTAAVILRSLVVTQSLTGSAVTGTIAGAAIVAITKTQLQWAINITQRAIHLLQWVLSVVKRVQVAVQWGRKVLPTATLNVGSGAAAIATAASGGTSQAESTASPAESTATPAESTATPAESTAESTTSPAESTVLEAESTVLEASQAESTATPAESTASPAESTASPAESTVLEASQAESAASPTESTATQAESAASLAESTASPAESTVLEASQAESAASPAESTVLEVSQAESAASQAESAASPAESTASSAESTVLEASQAKSAASPAESTASSAESEVLEASQAESAASPAESTASSAESTASPAASPAESTASSAESTVLEASQAESAASPAESAASPAESTILEASQAESAASPAESAASPAESTASPAESTVLEASQAESAASPAESAASPAESTASPAESTVLKASQAESVASPTETTVLEASEAESTASPAESTVLEASQAESAASPAESTASPAESTASPAESTASPAESTVLEASQAESAASPAESAASPAESTALPAESTVLKASQAKSVASPTESTVLEASEAESTASPAESTVLEKSSPAELAASKANSAASEGVSKVKSAASGGLSQAVSQRGASLAASGGTSLAASAISAGAASAALGAASLAASMASQGASVASGGVSLAASAASGRASLAVSVISVGASLAASGGASLAASAASGGASLAASAASGGASLAVSAISAGASLAASAASGGASEDNSAASGGESLAASAASGGASLAASAISAGASLAASAISAGASLAASAASGGASLAASAASRGASEDKSAASGGASLAASAISAGALLAASAASGGASEDKSAASGGASLAASAISAGASLAASAESGGASQAKSAASAGKSQAESAASPSELAGAIGLTRGLLGEGLGFMTVSKSKIFGSQGHRQLQTKAAVIGENKGIGTSGLRPDQHLQQEKCGREKIQDLFHKLHLKDRDHKLRAADVLQITEHSLQSHESCAEEELIQTFIQKLLMMDYRARYIHVNKASEQDHAQKDNDSSEDSGDIFKAVTLSNKGTSQSDRIHPMDLQMAVFHGSDGCLKQLMVTKLSQCQYALPLLVPDPVTQQIEFPLWTFRQINKSWKMRNTKSSLIQPIYKAKTPMVSFFRFGSVSSSKSHLMNSLINEKHNTFFHRNCPGSSRTRVLMDGVVEIAWFCPSGKNMDKFTDCVAFCNLHGDAGDHKKQLQILTEMASVNVVLLPRLDRSDKSSAIIQNLYKDRKPLICLFTDDESAVTVMKKGKFKIGLKDRNQSEVSEELRRAINDCLSGSSSTFRLEDVSKHSDIRVDEEDDEDCRRGREAAQQMMSLLEKKHLTEIKESFLPCQGKLWHQWSQKNKELHRPQGDELEKDISRKQTEMKKIREQQHECDIGKLIKFFIKQMNSHDEHERKYFIKWLRILLDEYISADLSNLHHKYNKQWSTVVKLKESHDKSEQLKTEQTGLERISEDLQDASLGLEHILREIGQIYESCSFVNKNKKDLQFNFSSLPSLAAEMMISGFPLELMDGDVAHVPVIWISAVLDQLIQKMGDQRVFVLSVLGLQSSGKSTMLNAMFGLQFAVSAGRCTRGAFMQLVKVSEEMKTQMNFDYILVVDTEGLCALELAGSSTRHHDNELATFVVGLGNLTLINIFGENPSEMQDILQIVIHAFMRMKKVKLYPRCVFVHPNISDVTSGEKNMEGRRRLQETVDEMTKLAAEKEVCDAERFSDVIKFDIQNDVKYLAQLWEGIPPMAPPNPNYCENIQELKETIMFYAAGLHGMRLTNLKVCINDLWEALLNERFVFSFRNSLDISVYRKLETKYSKWSWSLRSAMVETENKLHNKIENEAIHEVEETDLQRELKKTSEEVEKSMSEFFEKDKDKDILIQSKTSFDIKIKQLQENIVKETKRILNEVLQQRDLKKIIDARKTHHENTLYEKSKELSLKLKAKDEKTLKKEFDLLWKKSVKKIIRDTPPIKDIDIMRDAREILSDVYRSVYVGQQMESMNIFLVLSYHDYVKEKRSSGFFTKAKRSAKERLGYALSIEDEAQIRSLVTDVALKTAKMIQSFNISKMGYNISYIRQLIVYIQKRVTEHQEESMKYKFKDTFFIDLVLSICKRANKMITDQHMMFRDANDPVIYVEKKREEYYSIFQKYCRGAKSAAIFGEIICQKLKEPIEQSVYMKTARDLTDEMRANCQSLNGNRSNLEKHILKTLAEEEDFDKYINYIHNPRNHLKSFIRDEVSRYITDKLRVSVLPKMKENMKRLQQKIIKAAQESTEHVQENRGDVVLWLKSFTQRLSDELIFFEKDLSGVKHGDVDDFNLLEDVIRQEIPVIMSDISDRFNTETFPVNLDYKFRPDELLIDHFCQCCWVQCPFCRAVCTNTIENHHGDHSVLFHRVTGISGFFYREKTNLAVKICTSVVASRNQYFYSNASDDLLLCRDYRRAGGVYADWSITSDLSELPYWKWFLCRFQKHLEKYYNKTFTSIEIPDEWRKYSKQYAIESLDRYF